MRDIRTNDSVMEYCGIERRRLGIVPFFEKYDNDTLELEEEENVFFDKMCFCSVFVCVFPFSIVLLSLQIPILSF